MAIATVLHFPPHPGLSEQEARNQYDEVSRELSGGQLMTKAADWGPGLHAHVAGPEEDGSWWVIEVWESQDAMEQFQARLMPILQPRLEEQRISQPNLRSFTVHNLVTR